MRAAMPHDPWMPIRTAPQDGTTVRLRGCFHDGPQIVVEVDGFYGEGYTEGWATVRGPWFVPTEWMPATPRDALLEKVAIAIRNAHPSLVPQPTCDTAEQLEMARCRKKARAALTAVADATMMASGDDLKTRADWIGDDGDCIADFLRLLAEFMP